MVPPVPLEQLEALIRLSRGEAVDRSSHAGLVRTTEEYLAHRGSTLGRVTLEVDDAPAATWYAALVDPGRNFESIRLRLEDPNKEPESWDFLRPFREIHIGGGGEAEIVRPDGGKDRAMLRLALREHFAPFGSPKDGPAPRPRLSLPIEFASFIRTTGTVPFAIALEAYFQEERVRYELDLLDNTLLADPRAGRFRPESRVRRSPRFSHAVDSLVAKGDLSLPSVRAFESIVDSKGFTPAELAPLFSGVEELGRSALDALAARRLVVRDRRTGIYRVRTDALGGPGDRRKATPANLRPLGDPQLRTSVAELLAAADSQARCPLCGGPMPANSTGLVCPDCLERVTRAAAKSAE